MVPHGLAGDLEVCSRERNAALDGTVVAPVNERHDGKDDAHVDERSSLGKAKQSAEQADCDTHAEGSLDKRLGVAHEEGYEDSSECGGSNANTNGSVHQLLVDGDAGVGVSVSIVVPSLHCVDPGSKGD